MHLAVKRGQIPLSKASKSIQQLGKSMSEKELEKFAATKQKGLPKKLVKVNQH